MPLSAEIPKVHYRAMFPIVFRPKSAEIFGGFGSISAIGRPLVTDIEVLVRCHMRNVIIGRPGSL